MMNGDDLEKILQRIIERLHVVNLAYIRKVAAQIKKIGEMNQSSINRLLIMLAMNADIVEITNMLMQATALNFEDISEIYQKAVNDTYTDDRFRLAVKNTSKETVNQAKSRLTHFAQSVAAQSEQSLKNLSNTTILSETYRNAIDKAIFATSTGLDSYTQTMRDALRDIGSNGIQVRYPSGYKRRLDSAVRQNIVDGTKQIAQKGSLLMGEELEYDAVEISAHAMSAKDHEPVQGRVFLLSEFEKMQSGYDSRDVDGIMHAGFRRPIGEWNCSHLVFSFSTKYSKRMYSNAQLQKFYDDNHKGCVIDGKHYTTYEASQLMRKLETDVRKQKDIAVMAQTAGDETLRQECQMKINNFTRQYEAVANAAGLRQQKDRMQVQGFRVVPKKNLTEWKSSDIIGETTDAIGRKVYVVKRTVVRGGPPNGITQKESARGGLDRNYYDANGDQIKQISNNDHGHKKESALGDHGEHKHFYIKNEMGFPVHGEAVELNDDDRKENADIL